MNDKFVDFLDRATKIAERLKIRPTAFFENIEDLWMRDMVAAVLNGRHVFKGIDYRIVVPITGEYYRHLKEDDAEMKEFRLRCEAMWRAKLAYSLVSDAFIGPKGKLP